MSRFALLCSVNIQHDYFVDGQCPNLRVVPTEMSELLLKQYALLFRQTDFGFEIYYDSQLWGKENVIKLWSTELKSSALQFSICILEPEFVNYTDLPNNNLNTLIFDTSEADVNGNLGYQISSQSGDFAIVNISFNDLVDLKKLSLTPRNYTIVFNARKTIWNYFLLNSLDQEIQLEGDISFSNAQLTKTNNGKQALKFSSKELIPFHQKQQNKIYFSINQDSLLPAPAPRVIWPLETNGAVEYHSNVYVNL